MTRPSQSDGCQLLCTSLLAGATLAFGTPLSAQSAGPPSVIRDPGLSSSTGNFLSAFTADGAVLAWRDLRADAVGTYVQKLDADGVPVWTADGVRVSEVNTSVSALAPDGVGGLVVAWADNVSTFAQRISSTGAFLWGPGGLRIGDEPPGSARNATLHLATDGNYFVTYLERRPPPGGGLDQFWLIAERIDGNGQPLWGANGVDAIQGVLDVHSIPDGSGGLVVFGLMSENLFVNIKYIGFSFQRVLANQSLAWSGTVDLDVELSANDRFDFVADGDGGIIISFIESGGALRVVRVAGDGTLPWSESNTVLSASGVTTTKPPKVIADGSGGAFIAWVSSSPSNFHVQHVAANGTHLWGEGGAILPETSGSKTLGAMVSNEAGGLFIPYVVSSSFTLTVRMQQLDSQGHSQFQVGGNNYLVLRSGEDPSVGLVETLPLVVYGSNGGLFAQLIQLADPPRPFFTDVDLLPNDQIGLTLGGGAPNVAYNILRSTEIQATLSTDSWSVVGSIKSGETWIDTAPPLPSVFYIASDPEP